VITWWITIFNTDSKGYIMSILPGRRPVDLTRFKLPTVMFLLVTVLLGGVAITVAASADSPLHILLTNDDGYDAPGITAMHQALLEAGYKVSVVAPRDQQSGSSMRVTIGSISVETVRADFWTVAGTPADSVSFAMQQLFHDHPPDLVISGANLGQNLGANTNLSGTVGAAIMATQLGVPAIAISVGIKLEEYTAQPVRFPSTMDAFPNATAFIVQLVQRLEATHRTGTKLLPSYQLLNVNYPALAAAQIKGIRMTRVARAGGFVPRFIATSTPGEFRITLQDGEPHDDSVPDPDVALFADGYITLSILDGSLDAGRRSTTELEQRLGDLFAHKSSIIAP